MLGDLARDVDSAQRPSARWAIVAVGAMQPVLDPRVVLDAGYQLSVVGVAAMISAGQLGERIGVQRLPLVRDCVVAVTLLGTTIATIASAPIVAWVFGRVSLVAPLTNLAANPLIALAQPMIFCGIVLAPIRPARAAHSPMRRIRCLPASTAWPRPVRRFHTRRFRWRRRSAMLVVACALSACRDRRLCALANGCARPSSRRSPPSLLVVDAVRAARAQATSSCT